MLHVTLFVQMIKGYKFIAPPNKRFHSSLSFVLSNDDPYLNETNPQLVLNQTTIITSLATKYKETTKSLHGQGTHESQLSPTLIWYSTQGLKRSDR